MSRSRREFLENVGRGMLVASIGVGAAGELGLSQALAVDEPRSLSFGSMEPLVRLMQETSIDRLMPVLVDRLKGGSTLRELIAAGALANARTFGGEDYIGFHTLMALTPALQMASGLPDSQKALPVLKVLYRNSQRIQDKGGRRSEVLHPLDPVAPKSDSPISEQIRAAIHAKDVVLAERLLAASASHSPESAYYDLLPVVEEAAEVHRTVLAYRAWDLLDVVGRDNAFTMLRQSLHYCAKNCDDRYTALFAGAREILPKLLDQHHLHAKSAGTRVPDDAWVDALSKTIFTSTPDQAAEAVAFSIAEGMHPDAVAEAVSLATNQLVLRDPGRGAKNAQPNKPVGSVHGDSVGVHASDSANAWRNIAQVGDGRNLHACLILSAWQAAKDRSFGGDINAREPMPHADRLEKMRGKDPAALVAELDDAIRTQDQASACAAVHAYGAQDLLPQPVVDVLLKYAVTQDGALHAEKYFKTATQEFTRSRPRWRWRQLVALARVTASEYGHPAPGVEQAKTLMKV